jgi:hypothetical protein
MTSSGRFIARRDDAGRVELRPEPLRCRVRLGGLIASDDHALDATFTFSVLALNDRAEREMLAEAFLTDKTIATADDVASHFAAGLTEAAARVVKAQPAEHWTSDAARDDLIAALREAAKPIAFASGVDVLPPFELSLGSQTLQREKLETMSRRLAEKRAEGQAQHVQRAADLLKQFQSLRDAAPGLSPGAILDRVVPADRGSMLETLLLASAGETTSLLYAVAGPNLLRMDPRKFPMHADVIPLPGDLGPARSVQAGELDGRAGLLVGAQTGVLFIDPREPGSVTQFNDSEMTSQLGFNSVALIGERVWASHSDAGVVAWDLDRREAPAVTLRTAGAKNLVSFDHNRAIFSAGHDVFIATPDGQSRWLDLPPAAAVIFIAVDDQAITLARADGHVQRIDRATLKPMSNDRRCGETTSSALLPWLGTNRILLATADGPVCCVGADDALTTQFVSSHRGVRALAAAPDTVAGLSADRQRIVLWKSWDARQPAAEFHIAAIARHRAADLCFATTG